MSTNVDCDHCNQCCVLSLSLVACFELVHNAVSRYALERHQLHTFFFMFTPITGFGHDNELVRH
jgi:hypothetical protein